ncbi:MAG: LLM class flavin-dependent oxidoreductase [Duganella sp.]
MTTPSPSRELRLFLFPAAAGAHVAGWRHPAARSNLLDFEADRKTAAIAEAAGFDALFFADRLAFPSSSKPGAEASSGSALLEPLTLLAALSAVTSNIGLIATASTSYHHPYHLARSFASLDHLSKGRAGWNMVTSLTDAEAANFGRESHFAHGARYERAQEFVDVVRALWDSVEENLFLHDKQNNRYFDGARVHPIQHRGEHFSVQGPLNVPRPPQGHPLLVQAGSSEDGLQFAARVAEVIFTTQTELPEAQAFYSALKARVQGLGRDPAHQLIMPGLSVVVGRTRQEAQDKLHALNELIDIDNAVAFLSALSGGTDLSSYPLDGPLPELALTNGNRSKQALLTRQAREQNLTIRQLALQVAGSGGHRVLTGTAEDIADDMQLWFNSGAADGFNFKPLYLDDNLVEFSDQVLPILRDRGLFKRAYQPGTLRDKLGLPRPANRHGS